MLVYQRVILQENVYLVRSHMDLRRLNIDQPVATCNTQREQKLGLMSTLVSELFYSAIGKSTLVIDIAASPNSPGRIVSCLY